MGQDVYFYFISLQKKSKKERSKKGNENVNIHDEGRGNQRGFEYPRISGHLDITLLPHPLPLPIFGVECIIQYFPKQEWIVIILIT